MTLIYLIGWLGLSAACAFVARERGRSALGWGLAAVLCSPLVAYLVLVAIPRVMHEPLARHDGAPRWLDSDRDESPIYKDPL